MFQVSLLKDSDVEPLAEAVLEVLDDVGILCQNEQMRDALEEMGANVDDDAERVWFPKALVSEFIAGLQRENAGRATPEAQFGRPGLGSLGTLVGQFIYDYPKAERRQGNTRDLVYLTKFGDALHGAEGVGHSLLLTDVPPLLEPLEAAMVLTEYAGTPGPPFAWNARQVEYLLEMGDVVGIPNWYTLGAICISHPLRFDRDLADRFVLMARAGEVNVESSPGLGQMVRRAGPAVSIGLTAMPVAGASTPVTVEGFIVVSSAEHLAAWMAARALNSNASLGGSMWSGSIDIRTGQVSYSAFDAMYYAFASVEFVRRWTGVRVGVGGGEYASAKVPGMYTALEKAYKAMMIAAFTGEHPGIGCGMLDDGKLISPVQLLLERELGEGLFQFARTVDPTEDNIGLDAIREIGIGLRASHLQTEHTLHHYRSSLWIPQLIDRSGWDGFEQETRMLDKAQAKVDALVAGYRKPEGREDQLSAMRAVVDRARGELLA